MRKFAPSRVGNVLSWGTNGAMLLMLAAVLAVMAAPHVLGWRYGVLRSGSMSPAIPAGAAVVVAPAAPDRVQPGDVITFRSANNRDLLVTHRVADVTEGEDGAIAFRTKGDANEQPDGGLVTSDRLFGKVLWSVPGVGRLAAHLRTRTGFLLLIVLPTALIIANEMLELGSGILDLLRARKKAEAEG